MSHKLIVTVVPQYEGELIVNAARDACCPGGTVLRGRETSENGLVQLLGFGDVTKDITYNIVASSDAMTVIDAINKVTEYKKKKFGILFSMDVGEFFKAGTNCGCSAEKGEKTMSESNYQMINVIVNKGYAEDAMSAARKAGAGGGTIINARGTAKEGDEKFFGTEIVPEKDMLIILVPSEKKDDIVKAIMDLKCFQKPGTGIVFCNGVQDFRVLGKK
ncbi:MAG: transcriptional regulator [Treponema sp.]|uniref:P-II family nitrogen regulator n=1 Tax=Treponema sp. TaxID=166 RepID=UPI001E0FCCC7|nr:P-II family nitrogen regulator [Treponema sp.]MBS7310524.1 transcriptional regulator [Treponema sp.]MCI5696276.1 transcriptional regulator [Spirochaetia bacterium]MDD5812359.1 P-II family nitrogen regulator [Treponema sp.]MDY5885969.1 P-II family nitrogen regulator [Treponema sp.]